ncbi:MAG: hypothetical protein R2713_19260 [Ilumatobacteraceae bacterium]
MVTVGRALADHPSLAATLEACGIAPAGGRKLREGVRLLTTSEIVRER